MRRFFYTGFASRLYASLRVRVKPGMTTGVGLCGKVIPPRGDEHNSVSNDSNKTYNSDPVKKWPESGTDSAKTPKISPELQQIIDYWDSLPEHIKAAVKALVNTSIKQKDKQTK